MFKHPESRESNRILNKKERKIKRMQKLMLLNYYILLHLTLICAKLLFNPAKSIIAGINN
jgi:hypothetical protein